MSEDWQRAADDLVLLAKAGPELLAEVRRLERERDAWKVRTEEAYKLLHDLTPGGSEFVSSPARCAAWIREQLSSCLAQAVTASGERNQAEHERDELRRAITVFLSRHAETAPGCQCVSCQMFRAALAAEEGK